MTTPREIYNTIGQYFDHFRFTKVATDRGNSVYAAKIHTDLVKDHRYFFALVPEDGREKGEISRLSDLPWKCIQSRQIETEWPLEEQSPNFPDITGNKVLDVEYRVKGRSEDQTDYEFPEPFELCLLNDPSLKNMHKWGDKITLARALRSYSCILLLKPPIQRRPIPVTKRRYR